MLEQFDIRGSITLWETHVKLGKMDFISNSVTSSGNRYKVFEISESMYLPTQIAKVLEMNKMLRIVEKNTFDRIYCESFHYLLSFLYSSKTSCRFWIFKAMKIPSLSVSSMDAVSRSFLYSLWNVDHYQSPVYPSRQVGTSSQLVTLWNWKVNRCVSSFIE